MAKLQAIHRGRMQMRTAVLAATAFKMPAQRGQGGGDDGEDDEDGATADAA